MRRNVESCRVTMDDGALCTRLPLSVETAEGETVTETYEDAAGQAQWGIISKTAGVRAADVPDRAAWARRYFARYGRPDVQITVDGEELNRLTGERMDEMHLGRLCRVALAESGAMYNERIVSIRYPDLLRQPERVTVCLAGKEPEKADNDLFRAISGLPEKYRLPLLLRYMEGYSEKETAETMKISVAALKSRVFRARNQLKDMISEDSEKQ